MEQQSRERILGQICEYLSPDFKQTAFTLLYAVYQNEEYLAKEIGCSVELLYEWKKGKSKVSYDKYMPTILSLALTNCPEAGNLLEEELIKRVHYLCAELDICQKDHTDERLSKEDLKLFMDSLDEKSKKIFWHLRWHEHARLTELANLTGASTDMEVLYRLREIINPTADRIFGRSVVEFNESRIDRITGTKVLFNWWLSDFIRDNQNIKAEDGKHLVDLFDEDNQVIIISEVSPSMRVSDSAKVEQRHGILSITLDKLF